MPIVTYKPGPTSPLPEEPAPYVVPRMSQQVTAVERPKVWRVQEPDLAELQWLPARLAKEHPAFDPGSLFAWMRSAITDRMSLLVRTEKIVGLFTVETSPLDPGRPSVRERFVRSMEKDNDQATLLYAFVRDWAAGIGARELAYDIDSDCSMVSHVNSAMSDIRRDFSVRKSVVYTVVMG